MMSPKRKTQASIPFFIFLRRHLLSTVPLKRQVMKGKKSGWGTDTVTLRLRFKWFALGSESNISAWLHPFGTVPKSPNDDDIIKDDVIQEFQTCLRAYFISESENFSKGVQKGEKHP